MLKNNIPILDLLDILATHVASANPKETVDVIGTPGLSALLERTEKYAIQDLLSPHSTTQDYIRWIFKELEINRSRWAKLDQLIGLIKEIDPELGADEIDIKPILRLLMQVAIEHEASPKSPEIPVDSECNVALN